MIIIIKMELNSGAEYFQVYKNETVATTAKSED